MKWVLSTKMTQGQRSNDFSFVPENEPCNPSFVCDRDIDDPDGSCGCNRSLSGIHSKVATTTVKVASCSVEELDMAWGDDAGWLQEALRRFPIGSVLEFRDGRFYRRKVSA